MKKGHRNTNIGIEGKPSTPLELESEPYISLDLVRVKGLNIERERVLELEWEVKLSGGIFSHRCIFCPSIE